MLDGLGLYREENQTQREFAGVVAGELSQKPSGGEIGRLTKQITEYYYLVRFGNRSLDDGQQQDVNRALNDLESEISNVRQVKE